MKFLKIATSKSEKNVLSQKCSSLLDEAERIKKSPAPDPNKILDLLIDFEPLQPTQPAPIKTLSAPYSQRELPVKEKLIIAKASLLNGAKFLEWTSPPSPSEFALAADEPLYV